MNPSFLPAVVGVSFLIVSSPLAFAASPSIPNRLINYPAFLEDANEVGKLRESRRVTEDEFLRMAADPDTVVLDARSAEKFGLLHIKGAQNLSLPDMTADDLARIIPTKDTRVLIYCNNNFDNEPVAFAAKAASTSLNIYTFNTLHGYGYTNIYELGPLVDVESTKLPLEGTLRPIQKSR